MSFLQPSAPPADAAAVRALVLSAFCVSAEDVSELTKLGRGDAGRMLESIAAEETSPIEFVADHNGRRYYRVVTE